jgi:hypothetical protein
MNHVRVPNTKGAEKRPRLPFLKGAGGIYQTKENYTVEGHLNLPEFTLYTPFCVNI